MMTTNVSVPRYSDSGYGGHECLKEIRDAANIGAEQDDFYVTGEESENPGDREDANICDLLADCQSPEVQLYMLRTSADIYQLENKIKDARDHYEGVKNTQELYPSVFWMRGRTKKCAQRLQSLEQELLYLESMVEH
jgi:hypothetical protein